MVMMGMNLSVVAKKNIKTIMYKRIKKNKKCKSIIKMLGCNNSKKLKKRSNWNLKMNMMMNMVHKISTIYIFEFFFF